MLVEIFGIFIGGLFFFFELYWTFFWGIELSIRTEEKGFKKHIKEYITKWKRFNILGKFYFLILCVLSIPGVIISLIVTSILYFIRFISDNNRKNILYKEKRM